MMKQTNFYTYRAIITDVYDGDTCTADIDLGFGIWMRKQKLRLWGINTPEMRGAATGSTARDRVRELILHKEVILETQQDKAEKYGRWLATVWVTENDSIINVNELLIDEGLAKSYYGKGEK